MVGATAQGRACRTGASRWAQRVRHPVLPYSPYPHPQVVSLRIISRQQGLTLSIVHIALVNYAISWFNPSVALRIGLKPDHAPSLNKAHDDLTRLTC